MKPPAPSVAECLQLMDAHRMLANIKAHSLVVARVADLLARGLASAGEAIAVDTVIAGALLHDIGKTACLHTSENHAARGAKICLAHQLSTIAEIVDQHVVLKDYAVDGAFTEKEIVFYADKRVNHDRVVSLEERLAYILDRYGLNDPVRFEAIKKNFVRCRSVENKIFARLDFCPADISRLITT